MTQLSSQLEKNDSNTADFWSNFHFFPLQFDEFHFNYGYIYFIGYGFVMLILSVLGDIRHGLLDAKDDFFYFSRAFNKSMTAGLLTNWDFLFWAVGLTLILLFFNRWRKSIPIIFPALLCERRIRSVGQDCDLDQQYQSFLEEYQQALKSNKRYFFSVASISVTLILLLIWWMKWGIPAIQSTADPLLSMLTVINNLFLETLALLLIVYLFVVGAWTMFISGRYIKKLTTSFDLTIQPSHPDNCGGLKLLGDFSLATALPILILAVLLGLYGIVNVFQRILFWTVIANVGLIVFVTPLAIIAFFLPVWDIHLKMLNKKREFEDEYADRIAKLEEKIYTSLNKGELDAAKSAKEEIEILQAVHPNKISYPTWPFNAKVLLIFLTPQIVPLLSLIVGLNVNGPVAEALKSFLSIFSSHPNP